MKWLLVCAMLLVSSFSSAGIDVLTTIQNVSLGGHKERCGLVYLRVNGDDFRDATPSNPIYVRMELEKNATLSETLVDHTGSESGHHPIAVPVSLTSSTSSVINVPATGVTLVRWRKGEDEIWLKIVTSSSFWVTRNGVPGPPTPSDSATIRLGQTVAEAMSANRAEFESGRANLLTARRVDGGPVDIPHFVDLREASVLAAPAPPDQSLINVNFLAFGTGTSGVESNPFGPQLGATQFIVFSGGREVALAMGFRIDRWLYHVPRDGGGFSSEFLFVNQGGLTRFMILLPYDADGQALTPESVMVPGHGIVRISKATLYGDDPVSHVQILGSDECTVGISYSAESGESLTAHSPESRQMITGWEIFPETAGFAFDGFALVNLGTDGATLTATALDEGGSELGTKTLFADEPIGPLSKALLLLSDVIPAGTSPALVRISSSSPLGVVSLRGTLPGQDPASLFPIPVFTPSIQ